MMNQTTPKNVLGELLQPCCTKIKTGYFRDGFCRTNESDFGRHVICAAVTEEFLTFTKMQGNDLSTPRPEWQFPGLKAGDRWCLCALRWKEALEAGVAPPVILAATHTKALEFVSLEELQQYATQGDKGDKGDWGDWGDWETLNIEHSKYQDW